MKRKNQATQGLQPHVQEAEPEAVCQDPYKVYVKTHHWASSLARRPSV